MLSVRKTCPLKIRLSWNLQSARSARRTVKRRRFVLPTAEIIRKTNKNEMRTLIAFNSTMTPLKLTLTETMERGCLFGPRTHLPPLAL